MSMTSICKLPNATVGKASRQKGRQKLVEISVNKQRCLEQEAAFSSVRWSFYVKINKRKENKECALASHILLQEMLE